MANVELKQPIVDEIAALLDGAKSLVLVDYRGITVDQDTKLRKLCREANVVYKVFKNTLIKRAAKGTEFEVASELLDGPTAIAISKEDETVAARIIKGMMGKDAPALEFKGGVVEVKLYDAEGIKAFADIPSREVLLGRLLGSIQSPVTNFARVLKQIAEKDGEGEAA